MGDAIVRTDRGTPLESAPMPRTPRAPWRSVPRLCLFLVAVAALACGGDALERVRALQARGDYEGSLELLRAELAADNDAPEVLYAMASRWPRRARAASRSGPCARR